jgi:hypothetical protein
MNSGNRAERSVVSDDVTGTRVEDATAGRWRATRFGRT